MFSKIVDTASWQLLAQTQAAAPPIQSPLDLLGVHLLAAIVFSVVGVIVFFACLLLMEKLAPFSIIKEIGEEHNTALGIIVGAMVLGISIIIAAAILG
jgi:putative membrane protein